MVITKRYSNTPWNLWAHPVSTLPKYVANLARQGKFGGRESLLKEKDQY